MKDGHPVTFALHGFIEFRTLADMFPYIESQSQRWGTGLDEAARQRLASELLRRGIESRVISMMDERPLETLITHTSGELRQALAMVKESVPAGYGEAFLAVQEKWKHSLNCWSAAPSIPARVLSNWYPIEEGICFTAPLYDSDRTFLAGGEISSRPTLAQLTDLLDVLVRRDWGPWLRRLDSDPKLYLPNAYAIEFLRYNLTPQRLAWFRGELAGHGLRPDDHARLAQQRGAAAVSLRAFEEKVLWGDLADLFHLVYHFSAPDDPMRKTWRTATSTPCIWASAGWVSSAKNSAP